MRNDGDILTRKRSGQFIVEQLVLLGYQGLGTRMQSLERAHTVIAFAIIGLERSEVSIGSDLKQLIQI